MLLVQLGINRIIVRVMFGNFAKIGRAAGATRHRMITYTNCTFRLEHVNCSFRLSV